MRYRLAFCGAHLRPTAWPQGPIFNPDVRGLQRVNRYTGDPAASPAMSAMPPNAEVISYGRCLRWSGRSASPSRRVRRMTIGCVPFFSAPCSPRNVDTTLTGSGSLPASKEHGRTFRRNEIAYLYRARNLIERFFNKIKQCRRVATRYDKLAGNYLAFVKLAFIRIWLRANESTP